MSIIINRRKMNLSGVDFKNADLRGAIFTDAIFTEANFENADLRSYYTDELEAIFDFTGCNFSRANFSGADLRGAVFSENTDFYKANMKNVIFADENAEAPENVPENAEAP